MTTTHHLPWRTDTPAGTLALLGLAVAFHQLNEPAGVYTTPDGAAAHTHPDLAALITANTTSLWGDLTALTRCPFARTDPDTWRAAIEQPGGRWVEAAGWPIRPAKDWTINKHPLAASIGVPSSVQLPRTVQRLLAHVNWPTALTAGQPATDLTCPAGWDITSMRRARNQPLPNHRHRPRTVLRARPARGPQPPRPPTTRLDPEPTAKLVDLAHMEPTTPTPGNTRPAPRRLGLAP